MGLPAGRHWWTYVNASSMRACSANLIERIRRMGHVVELNDTLKLKRGAGFPENLRVGGVYEFSIAGRRLYNLKPTRVFLVEDIDGKWNMVGHAMILRQTIDAVAERTTGQFEVSQLYPPEYVRLVNRFDTPAGKGYELPPQ